MELVSRPSRPIAIAYAALLVLVVLAANGGLMPGTGQEFPGSPFLGHPYRVSMAASVLVLAALLGTWTALEGAARGKWLVGLILLVGGGVVTGLALETTPWVLYPGDRYSAAFMWLLAGAPIGFLSWLAVTLRSQRAPR